MNCLRVYALKNGPYNPLIIKALLSLYSLTLLHAHYLVVHSRMLSTLTLLQYKVRCEVLYNKSVTSNGFKSVCMKMRGVALILLHAQVLYQKYNTLTYWKFNIPWFKNNLCGSVQGMGVELLWDKHSRNVCISSPPESENTNHFIKESDSEKTLKKYSTPCSIIIK